MAPSLEAVASTRVSPDFFAPVRLPAEAPPQLFVIVDTEEEFDWSAGFSRSNVSVTAIDEVGRLQDVLRPYKLKPTYVIDYPVASTPASARRLARFAGKDECHIGAHLHPWVNPPATEPLGPGRATRATWADLERAKISALREAIIANLGVTPRVYKAGRYGFGRTTADTLEALGFDVDVSVNPHMNYEGDGGPSFEGFDVAPGSSARGGACSKCRARPRSWARRVGWARRSTARRRRHGCSRSRPSACSPARARSTRSCCRPKAVRLTRWSRLPRRSSTMACGRCRSRSTARASSRAARRTCARPQSATRF